MTEAEIFLEGIENSDIYSQYLNLKVTDREVTPVDYAISLANSDNYVLVGVKVRDLFINSNLGLRFVDSGCFRTVFGKSGLVAKITYNEDGSNSRELGLIKYLNEHGFTNLLKYLCPVLASNDSILITPVCVTPYTVGVLNLPMLKTIQFSRTSQYILSEFKKVGIAFKDILGVHQWGMLDGQLVILDYADWHLK